MNNIILLDGAMGTYAKKNGIKYKDIPMLAINNRNLLINIHKDYLNNGSNFINANTFRLNPYVIKSKKLLSKLIDESLTCANTAIKNMGFGKVCYNIGPLGISNFNDEKYIYDCYHTIRSLIEHRKDIYCIFIETQYMLKEALLSLEAFKECKIPVWLSFSFNSNGLLSSGESIEEVIDKVKLYDISALGSNCGDGPNGTLNTTLEIKKFWDKPIIAKPNLGLPEEINGELIYNVSPEEFSSDMKKIIKCGATIIGGCCGTNPSYIKAVSHII